MKQRHERNKTGFVTNAGEFCDCKRNKVRSRLGFLEKMVPGSMPLKTPKNAKRQLNLRDSSEGYNEENPAAGKKEQNPFSRRNRSLSLRMLSYLRAASQSLSSALTCPLKMLEVLQFLEFCSKFGKALGLTGGAPQLVVTRSLRSNRADGRSVASLSSDRAWLELGRYVAAGRTLGRYVATELGSSLVATDRAWLVRGPIAILELVRVCCLGTAISNGQWRVRGQRSRNFHELHHKTQLEPVPNNLMANDQFLWRHGVDVYKDSFNAAKTWEQIRNKRNGVSWSSSIWFSQGIPRYAFIVWLAVQNKLATGDRLRKWGIQQGCVLCGERDETRDHLFFVCLYSYTVWDRLASRLVGRRINPDWQDMLRFIQTGATNRTDQILIRLVFQAVVFSVWRERNGCRHQQSLQGTEQMIKAIHKGVKNMICSLRSVGLSASDDRWFNVLGDCLAESEVKLVDFPPKMFQKGIAEYEEMGSPQRLKLLNFLCDETLSTTLLRDCFANPESVDKKKEAKEKLNAAKDNEQKLYQKIEDEFSKSQAEKMGGLFFVIASAEVQEYDDVLRTSPVELDDNGLTLWKLKS
ncbi:hypothetical protein IGI04_018684 [Brassica rapa subsp. trilocularis]|uniref:Reverse transcriptase zinc-binding domain-containing protein n=1 Tax=Brassica rapa subsp. trilocularis TaxID=1813537 RepID=A0ABQ7MDR3_BRACM|nr:hypothetical protein IGI04_018684 [Brassica rapa subsp. trilocularis]